MTHNLKQLALLSLSYFFLHSFSFSQCSGTEPVVFLGNDTILCQGQSLNLTGPAGYDAYTWSTSSTSNSINVNTSGTYILAATVFSGNSNLVVNGDFEAGNSGFTSDYGFISFTGSQALWDPGFYAVGQSPNDYHSNFYTCTDKTSGSGLMYIANGSSSANTIIWSQTIAVQANTNYNFSAWVSSVENTSSPAVLQFFVNGSQIGNVFSPSSTGCTWGEFFNLWNSGTNTSAIISIVNQNTEPSGNDFALDDISFIPYCTNSDTIVVTYDPISLDAGQNLTFCSGTTENLTAVSNDASASFLWSTNETSATISPLLSQKYYVTATSTNGCTVIDSVNVTIQPSLDANFSTESWEVLIPYTANFENLSTSNVTYTWLLDDSLILTTTSSNPFIYPFTEAGTYTITLIASDVNSCPDTMELVLLASDEEVLNPANVFTPNADGMNDVYQFNMKNIKTLSLLIFNRWGQEVKHIDQVTETWDGKDTKGNELSAGVYFYKYEALGGSGNELQGQGFIHLVR